MNNRPEITTNDIIIRYIDFVERTVPVITECVDYISATERHMFEAVMETVRNDHHHDQQRRQEQFRPRSGASPFTPHTRRENTRPMDQMRQRDIRQSNINNNNHRNSVLDNISSIFTGFSNDIPNRNISTTNDNDLQNYITNLTNILNSPINRNSIPLNLEPVIVRPSPQQIENACESLSFHTIENPLNSNCPILVEPFQPTDIVTRIIYCGHCFNPPSLQRWFNTNVRCPVCRYDIRNYNPNTRNQIPTSTTPPLTSSPTSTTPPLTSSPTSTTPPEQDNHLSHEYLLPVDASLNILYTGIYYYNQQDNNNEPETNTDTPN